MSSAVEISIVSYRHICQKL